MTFDRALADAPRWMFLCILVYAPWAYGCTYRLPLDIFNQFAAALLALWAAACVWRRRPPLVVWLPTTLLALLLLQGWWMAWNAHSVHYYRTWTTVNRIWDHPPFPDWPGAIDRLLSRMSMLNVTALAGLFLFACDLMARPVWRKRVLLTMVLTALTVAVGGAALKLGGQEARELVWEKSVAKLPTTFATYRYHGNAASLLAIGWALTLGFTVAAAGRRGQPVRLALWVGVLLGLLFGQFMNTSRAGWALAVLLAGLIGARFLWLWWHTSRQHFEWRRGLLQGGLLALSVLVLLGSAFSSDWKAKLIRIQETEESLQQRYPSHIYHHLAREVGPLGHGPDGFQMALPVYVEVFGLPADKHGFWRHAHNDYYEYLANWGWAGSVPWVVLFGGGLVLGLRAHFRAPVTWGSAQWVLSYCGAAALVAILIHARWDFPLEKASILLYFLTLVADGWARALSPEDVAALEDSTASAQE